MAGRSRDPALPQGVRSPPRPHGAPGRHRHPWRADGSTCGRRRSSSLQDHRRAPGLAAPQARRRPRATRTLITTRRGAACASRRRPRSQWPRHLTGAALGCPRVRSRCPHARRHRWRPAGPDDGAARDRAGAPAAPARRGRGRLRRPGHPRPGRRRLHRPAPRCGAVTAGCAVVTFDHEHVPTAHLHALEADGIAVRPGPGRARARPGQGRDAALGSPSSTCPCPRNAVVDHDRRRRGLRRCRACSRRPAAATTARASGSSAPSPTPRPPSTARRGRRCARCWPRSSSTSAASCPPWWRARRAARPRRTRSSPPPSSTASATRSSPRRRTSRPPWPVEAQEIALRIAGALDVTGILAVELFETTDGRILVNELAMRPHNTGHWTQDGAVTSQFENHLRAVMDLPLGSPAPASRWTVMVNILGGPTDSGRLYDGSPARDGPRSAPARAPLRQGPAARPQGRTRQCVRRRPR